MKKPTIEQCSPENFDVIMQNKANLRKAQMDVSFIITRDYEKKLHWTFGENKPKQTQFLYR